MSLDRLYKLLRATDRAAGLFVQKAKGNLSIHAKHSVLIIDGLPDVKLCHRDFINHRYCTDNITHLGREPVTALHCDNRDCHSVFLTFLNRIPALDHQVVPRTLEVTDVVRVMDDAHLVGFVVSDRERCLRINHNKNVYNYNKFVLLLIFQCSKSFFVAFYL